MNNLNDFQYAVHTYIQIQHTHWNLVCIQRRMNTVSHLWGERRLLNCLKIELIFLACAAKHCLKFPIVVGGGNSKIFWIAHGLSDRLAFPLITQLGNRRENLIWNSYQTKGRVALRLLSGPWWVCRNIAMHWCNELGCQ